MTLRGRAAGLLAALSAWVLILSGAPTGFLEQANAAVDAPDTVATLAAGSSGTGLPAEPAQITLVTGDVVSYGGSTESVTVTMAEGTMAVDVFEGSDGTYAVPRQVDELLAAGVLDPQLFNLTVLAEQGYSDTDTGHLPLIIAYEAQEPAGPHGTAPVSAAVLADRGEQLLASGGAIGLRSINGVAVDLDKTSALDVWQRLRPDHGAHRTDAGETPGTLAEGVERIWLDRQATVALDESASQIGAPAAWDLGYDGTGTTIAVLDTGYDPHHPDLAGRVSAAESFVQGETPVDGHGHGTHVAATAAGTGAASGGTYTGVAHGADLIVGKVLPDSGTGPISNIIAGMEWATLDRGADVVNLSLGACCSDGTDVLSQAVDTLTQETGALFVVAAGNSGPAAGSINTPGAAASALTVGAVDRRDEVARFSSRGPVSGTFALKPDLVAPGVAIVAARGEGTSLGTRVDDRYTRASGTSMATPHVAGAAAILAQRFPTWDPAALRAALMSTSEVLDERPDNAGAGRVDVAAAATRTVFAATGSVDFGVREWPYAADPEHRPVRYTNTGQEQVTLSLALDVAGPDGTSLPDGLLTIDTDTVTIPAGSAAEVVIALDPIRAAGTAGRLDAVLSATSDQGRVLHNPVGLYLEPETFPVTVELLTPQDGTSDGTCSGLLRLDAVDGGYRGRNAFSQSAPCTFTMSLPAGTYLLWHGHEYHAEDGTPRSLTGVFPEVVVTGDTDVTFDLRQPVTARVDTPRPTEDAVWMSGFVRQRPDGSSFHLIVGHASQTAPVTVATDPVTVGEFRYYHQPVLVERLVQMSVVDDESIALNPRYANTEELGPLGPIARYQLQRLAGHGQLPVVYVAAGSDDDFTDVDVTGKLVLVELGDLQSTTAPVGAVAQRATQAGAAAVLAFTTGPVYPRTAIGALDPAYVPTMYVLPDEGEALRDILEDGPASIRYAGNPQPSYAYRLYLHYPDRIPQSLARTVDHAELAALQTSFHSETQGRGGVSASVVHRDGVEAQSRLLTFETPAVRTEFYGPTNEDLMWRRTYEPVPSVGFGDVPPGQEGEIWRSLDIFAEPGQHGSEWWGTPATVPGVLDLPAEIRQRVNVELIPPVCGACREGNFLKLFLQGTDGHPARVDRASSAVVRDLRPGQQLRLTADGEPVPLEYQPAPYYSWNELRIQVPMAAFELPAETAQIELHQSLEWPWIDRDFGQQVDTTWGFRSAPRPSAAGTDYYACPPGPGCYPEALILLGYDLGGLGLDNTAPADAEFTFQVTPYYQEGAGAPITEVGVEVSFDDGASWRAADVTAAAGGSWQVFVDHPALAGSTGEVSLRTTARDADGGWVEQTMLRAYGLSDDPLRCPHPDLRATVVIDLADSGVPNREAEGDCTINDLIEATADWDNHGQFVRHVRDITGPLVSQGVIDARERGQIVRAAANSGVGRPDR